MTSELKSLPISEQHQLRFESRGTEKLEQLDVPSQLLHAEAKVMQSLQARVVPKML